VAQVIAYISGSNETKAKGGLTVKQVAPVGVSPEKVVAPILPVDQLWRSAKLKREKLPQRKRPLRRE